MIKGAIFGTVPHVALAGIMIAGYLRDDSGERRIMALLAALEVFLFPLAVAISIGLLCFRETRKWGWGILLGTVPGVLLVAASALYVDRPGQ